jgi:glucokinase
MRAWPGSNPCDWIGELSVTKPCAIAIDLGGTQIRAAAIDRQGLIHARVAAATPAQDGPQAVIAVMHRLAMEVAQAREVLGVGLASPGPVNTRSRVALGIPTLAGFDDVDLGALLDKAFGHHVVVENDAIAAAIGEWQFGAGRGCSDVVYITVSTGIGGGVIANGQVLRGRDGFAGHLGHILLVDGGAQCLCGRHGCWEAYASGTALERRSGMTAVEVFGKAAHGDAAARALVRHEARLLGKGIVNLLHAFDPERVIMGGGLALGFDQLTDHIHETIAADAMPAFRERRVVRAERIGDSGLLGVAALVFEGFEDRPK